MIKLIIEVQQAGTSVDLKMDKFESENSSIMEGICIDYFKIAVQNMFEQIGKEVLNMKELK